MTVDLNEQATGVTDAPPLSKAAQIIPARLPDLDVSISSLSFDVLDLSLQSLL